MTRWLDPLRRIRGRRDVNKLTLYGCERVDVREAFRWIVAEPKCVRTFVCASVRAHVRTLTRTRART